MLALNFIKKGTKTNIYIHLITKSHTLTTVMNKNLETNTYGLELISQFEMHWLFDCTFL